MIEVGMSFMTEEFVVCAYTYLVRCKVKMTLGGSSDMADGQINGYLCCLEDMFGQATPEDAERATDEKKSIFHVIDRIVAFAKPAIMAAFPTPNQNLTIECWIKIQSIIKQYTRDYVIDNFRDCMDGLQSI